MSELTEYKVSKLTWLTESLIEISFGGYEHSFIAGQHVTLSTVGNYENREYSIFSGTGEDDITLLIKIVEDGFFTPKLKLINVNDVMVLSKPHGSFSFQHTSKSKHWFIATGTGIAPMNSMIKSNSGFDYHVVHGVRLLEEAQSSRVIDGDKLSICVSRDPVRTKYKRVTECIPEQHQTNADVFYLCGNGAMVYDCKNLLRDAGVSPERIFTEVYF